MAAQGVQGISQAAINDLKAAVKAQTGYDLKDSYASRILLTWPNAAVEHGVDTAKWRMANNVDTILDKPIAKEAILKKVSPHKYCHGVDRDGNPIYVEKLGKINAQALLANVTEDELCASHIRGLETLMRTCEEQTAKLGRPIETFTVIMDLADIGMSHRTIINYFRKTSDIDAKYYPARVKRVFLVNSGWFVPAFVGILKTFMPADFVDRFQTVSGDPFAALSESIDPMHIPAEYGGSCKCEGGPQCIPVLDASDLMNGAAVNDGFDRANVAAGSTLNKSISTPAAGTVLTWSFESAGEYDIGFGVTVVEAGAAPVTIVESARVVGHKGTYTTKSPNCQLVCAWDNSYSWLTSKDIKYFIGSDTGTD